MSFNILGAVVHGAESFLMSGGNPIAAGIGALEGGITPSAPQMPAVPNIPLQSGMNDALAQQPDVLAEVSQLSNLAKEVQL